MRLEAHPPVEADGGGVVVLDLQVQIRREHFPDGRYPCSALLTISGFARPGIVIEIQGVAVI